MANDISTKGKKGKGAGKDDEIGIKYLECYVTERVEMKELDTEKPEKTTEVPNHGENEGIRSIDLTEGVSIQAYSGGIKDRGNEQGR